MPDPSVPPETPIPEPVSVAPTDPPSPGPSAGPATLPLPAPDDTPADLLRTLHQTLQSPAPMEAAEPPLLPALPPPVAPAPRPTHPFVFHGSEREYFRIWIVNTLLTLLTAGLFSAWAKVRKRRYLRGNTELLGHRFDYRARPVRILLGNLIVAVLFVAYSFVGQVYWQVGLGALLVGIALLPWVVIRSLAFNAHNTTYRGLPFYFHQTYGMTALTYLGQALCLPFTLGLYYPAWMRNRREFIINHHRLEDSFFRFEGRLAPFYTAYVVAGVCLLAAFIGGALLMAGLIHLNGHAAPTLVDQLPLLVLYGFAFYVGRHYVYATLFNHVWNHTRLDDHRFVATMDTGRWLKLQLGNLGAILVSGGLLYPWAAIRSARFALGCLHFQPSGPIEHIERLGRDEGSALGDSAGEFVGMDFGL